jgi:hypothetical protein
MNWEAPSVLRRGSSQGIPALLQMINSSPNCLAPIQVQAITQAVENLILPTKTKPIPKPKPVKHQNPII